MSSAYSTTFNAFSQKQEDHYHQEAVIHHHQQQHAGQSWDDIENISRSIPTDRYNGNKNNDKFFNRHNHGLYQSSSSPNNVFNNNNNNEIDPSATKRKKKKKATKHRKKHIPPGPAGVWFQTQRHNNTKQRQKRKSLASPRPNSNNVDADESNSACKDTTTTDDVTITNDGDDDYDEHQSTTPIEDVSSCQAWMLMQRSLGLCTPFLPTYLGMKDRYILLRRHLPDTYALLFEIHHGQHDLCVSNKKSLLVLVHAVQCHGHFDWTVELRDACGCRIRAWLSPQLVQREQEALHNVRPGVVWLLNNISMAVTNLGGNNNNTSHSSSSTIDDESSLERMLLISETNISQTWTPQQATKGLSDQDFLDWMQERSSVLDSENENTVPMVSSNNNNNDNNNSSTQENVMQQQINVNTLTEDESFRTTTTTTSNLQPIFAVDVESAESDPVEEDSEKLDSSFGLVKIRTLHPRTNESTSDSIISTGTSNKYSKENFPSNRNEDNSFHSTKSCTINQKNSLRGTASYSQIIDNTTSKKGNNCEKDSQFHSPRQSPSNVINHNSRALEMSKNTTKCKIAPTKEVPINPDQQKHSKEHGNMIEESPDDLSTQIQPEVKRIVGNHTHRSADTTNNVNAQKSTENSETAAASYVFSQEMDESTLSPSNTDAANEAKRKKKRRKKERVATNTINGETNTPNRKKSTKNNITPPVQTSKIWNLQDDTMMMDIFDEDDEDDDIIEKEEVNKSKAEKNPEKLNSTALVITGRKEAIVEVDEEESADIEKKNDSQGKSTAVLQPSTVSSVFEASTYDGLNIDELFADDDDD